MGYPVRCNRMFVYSSIAQQSLASQAQAKLANEPKEIQIISDPPGARIEVNQDYVGDAPITIKVRQLTDISHRAQSYERYPPRRYYVQTKSFIAAQSTMEEAVSLGTGGDETHRAFFSIRVSFRPTDLSAQLRVSDRLALVEESFSLRLRNHNTFLMFQIVPRIVSDSA